MSALDLAAARAWRDADPDPDTQRELDGLIARAEAGDQAAAAEIADAFAATLAFGTAGLRGRVAAGPNRMNLVVVARAAAGLGSYLRERGGGSVVIGYDRRVKSDLFARATAQILEGAGLHALLLPEPLPTPVLAFAIRRLGCAAGVMVTASHNPPADNGYKVYLGDGLQIVSPADAEISAHIAEATARGPVRELPHGDGWTTLGEEVVDDYVSTVAALVADESPRDIRVVYTPLHGVGGRIFLRAMAAAGFPEPAVVEPQFEPDGSFPTVSFPNPEEPGTMDLSLALAAEVDADVIIASDPDADRCAAGIPTADGGWRMLHGDELGALLAWWMIRRGRTDGVFAQSLVSSSLLERLAADAGAGYARTLIGFKWIARVPGVVYGYEEALGYCVDPANVSDKDGISAGVMLAELFATLKAEGRTAQDVLDDLARQHGVYLTDQVSLRVTDLGIIASVMARLRATPPTQVAGIPITRTDDLAPGWEGLPPLDGLRFELASGGRIIIRPSGTEPKVKCYLQAVVPVTDDDVAAARAAARAELDAAMAAVREWMA